MLPAFRGIPFAGRVAERMVFHAPDIRVTYNSTIPFSLNDGAMWAGRGTNLVASGGVGFDEMLGGFRVRGALAPAFIFSENGPFDFFATPDVFKVPQSGRSPYASPWHGPGRPMDLPLRFGGVYQLRIGPGRSALSVERYGVRLGITAEDETWGPGIRNQLVLSANAPAIPRVSLRSTRPIRARIGRLDWRLAAGVLTESMYFDSLPDNDYRAFSGMLLELRPATDSNLTIGFARVVIAPTKTKYTGPYKHALDALFYWSFIGPDSALTFRGSNAERSDQLASLFARWVIPQAGLEIYGELARIDFPKSLTELLTAPHYSGGITLGMQWAHVTGPGRYVRLQMEATSVEQSVVFQDRPLLEFYVGRAAIQGFTNRGQVIGASIGPGGSSQWLAVDRLWHRAQAGAFLGRIRWENDAFYRQPAPNFFRHDVTIYGGVRGGLRTRFADFHGEAGVGYRYNYLFQWGGANPGLCCTVDVRNWTFSLTTTPR